MSPDPILRAVTPAIAVMLGLIRLFVIPSSYDAGSVTTAPAATVTPSTKGDFLGAQGLVADARDPSPVQNAVERTPTAQTAGTEPAIATRDLRFQPPPVQPSAAQAPAGQDGPANTAPALIPIPRDKPARLALAKPGAATSAPGEVRPPAGLPVVGGTCSAALTAAKVTFEALPPVARGACVITAPISLKALGGSATAKLDPAATIGCALAQNFADWVANVVQPAAMAEFGAPVTTIRIADAYSCRPVDHITGAKLSEHSFGNAIDVGGFQVGRTWIVVGGRVDPNGPEARFFAKVRKAACTYFTTVLGPGSDAYHADNLHLDLARHNTAGTYRICE